MSSDLDLIKSGIFKSSTTVVKNFADILKKGLLNPDEEIIKNPAGFINILASQIGEMQTTAFYEQLMYKNELFPSTALKLRSLFRHLNSDEITDVFGTPSNLIFVLGFSIDDLKNVAIYHPESNTYRVKINKDIKFLISTFPPFTLDYDIWIIISNINTSYETIYATYDLNYINEAISPITTPIINTRIFVYNNTKHILLYLLTRQYVRTYFQQELLDKIVSTIYVPYSDNLMAFEVYYQDINNEENTMRRLIGQPEGILNPDGYNYSIEQYTIENASKNGGQLLINFSQSPNAFNPNSGLLKIVIYTTSGTKGNISINNLSAISNSIQIQLAQDRNDPYQEALVQLSPILTLKELNATGGKNFKTLEEIREYVITKNHTRGLIISPGEIERIVSQYGLSVYKIRSDVRSLDYKIIGTVIDSNNIIIPTVMKNIKINIDEYLPVIPEINARIIKPTMIFKETEDNKTIEFNNNPVDFSTYITNYKNNINLEYSFPFLIKVNTTSELKLNIYDINNENVEILDFIYFNEKSQNKINANELYIHRNSLTMDYIEIIIPLTVDDSIYDYYKNKLDTDSDIVRCKLILKNKDNKEQYVTDATIIVGEAPNILNAIIRLKTNDAINDNDKLMLTDYSIKPFPYIIAPSSFYFIENNVEIKLLLLLKDTQKTISLSTIYDDFLDEDDKYNDYYISIIYENTDISLFKKLTDYIDITPEIQFTQPIFAYYEDDIIDTYETDVYEVDADGTFKIERVLVTDPLTGEDKYENRFIIKYHKGETKLDADGNIIYKHRKNELKLDDYGNPVVITKPKKILILRSAPVYNRIYNNQEKYFEVINGYYSLIEKMKNLNTRIAGGCTLKLGLYDTIGYSDGYYRFYNQNTENEEYLDSISLSLSIGVKFFGNLIGTDITYLISMIKNEIVQYINDFKITVEKTLSFNKMLEYIKNKIPNIDYFEIYRVNNYKSGSCQSIYLYLNNETIKKKLCIKHIVDETIYTLEQKIQLIPNIDVHIIK